MRIVIDGDGCSGIDLIVEIAKKYNLEVYLFCDFNHLISNDYINVNYVDEGSNSVDMVIANFVNYNDIVITYDYGLATLVIDKCKVINYRGLIYNKNNIDFLLENRHTNLKIKKGPKKMTDKDYELLKKNLIKLIEVCK